MLRIPERSISPFINQQLPDFIKENYPTFIAFLEAYYEWLELTGNAYTGIKNLITYRDVDLTLDEFVDHFRKEFLVNIPISVLADKRLLVKHIKDFYRARGSEKSYKFLFRILYNENVEFYYPKKDLLRPSDGKWDTQKVIRVTTIHDTSAFVSRELRGVESGAHAHIESVIRFNIGANLVSELTLSSVLGTFIPGELINVYLDNNNIIQESIYGIVSEATIVNPGTGYSANDLIIVDGDGSNALISIESVGGTIIGRVISSENSAVDDIGPPITYTSPTITVTSFTATAVAILHTALAESDSIDKIRVLSQGYSYTSTPDVTVTGNGTAVAVLNLLGKVERIIVTNPGSSYTGPPTITIDPPKDENYYVGMNISIIDGPGIGETKRIISFDMETNKFTVNEDWSILPTIDSHYSIALGQIKKIAIKDFGLDYTSATADVTNIGNGNAEITLGIGALGTFPGRWVGTDSFLSNDKRLQDSYYWQDFSYVLKTGNSINTYRDIVKKLLHPAGTIVFGEVDIESHFMIDPTYKNLERNKFYYAPYEHFRQRYHVNAGDIEEFQDPTTFSNLKTIFAGRDLDYVSPNDDYYYEPYQPANTSMDLYGTTTIETVTLEPETKRNHVADPYVKIIKIPNNVPTLELLTEYDCILNLSDRQRLWDIQSVNDKHHGVIGRTSNIETSDPSFSSTGLLFNGVDQMATCLTVPVNPLKQTVVIIAKVNNLNSINDFIGCIDVTGNTTVSGYSISVDTNGALIFRSQKNNGIRNDLLVSTPNGTIIPQTWFTACLRYNANTLTGDVNRTLKVTGQYGVDVDGTPIVNNSSGWIIGNKGFVPPYTNNSYFNRSIFGKTLWGFRYFSSQIVNTDTNYFGERAFGTGYYGGINVIEYINSNVLDVGNFLDGNVAYVLVYNRDLSDIEYTQAYLYLKVVMIARGISLP